MENEFGDDQNQLGIIPSWFFIMEADLLKVPLFNNVDCCIDEWRSDLWFFRYQGTKTSGFIS